MIETEGDYAHFIIYGSINRSFEAMLWVLDDYPKFFKQLAAKLKANNLFPVINFLFSQALIVSGVI